MLSFGRQLQVFRNACRNPQGGGLLTQQTFATLLQSELGLLEWPRFQTISDWERDQKRLDAYTDRNVLVVILQVLARCDGLPGSRSANAWLVSGGYAPLNAQEIQQIFPTGDGEAHSPGRRWVGRIEAPTYTRLFGVERTLTQLTELLAAPVEPRIVSLEGLGGLGKTALAHRLTTELMQKGTFADLAWISARPASLALDGSLLPNPAPVLAADEVEREMVVQLLGDETATELLRTEERRQLLLERLAQAPHLLVIDNLETVADAQMLSPLLQRFSASAKFLLTTRERLPTSAYHFSLPPLEEADALELLRYEARHTNLPHVAAASDDQLRPLYAVVGGNPLALRLALGQLHLRELDALAQEWQEAVGWEIEALYTFIYRSAWDRLDEACRYAFLAMPLAAEQGGRLTHLVAVSGMAEGEMVAALKQLVTLNLVNVHGGLNERRYAIHSLTRSFLHRQVAQWWP